MNDQLFSAAGVESFYFGCLVNLNIPDQILILQTPDLKLLSSVHNHQMRSERNLQYLIAENSRITPDCKQVFSGFDSMEWYSFLVAVTDASIAVVVLEVFDDELLADVYDAVEFLSG